MSPICNQGEDAPSTSAISQEPTEIVDASPAEDEEKEEPIQVVTKRIRLSPELPVFDQDFYRWKKDFWKERIKHIKNVVAPMVDQSELAFRMMLRSRGADLCYTPMIHAHLFVNDFTYRKGAFSTIPSDRPLIVQFCANDPNIFLEACRLVEGFCDGVDLNLGCPQLIAKRGRYGAYLQESPEIISSLVSTVFKHCRLPLSVKIRVLDTPEQTIEYAKMIQDAGASMLAVHGRRRQQKGVQTGLADWSIIQEVKKALQIPVIANGNIQMKGDVDKCIAATGVDSVMSAEGILANPLLFVGKHLWSSVVAQEYLGFAEKYKATVSSIRAHIFRICHYSLLLHSDLRAKNSYVFTIPEFREIINELEERMKLENGKQGMIGRSWEDLLEDLPEGLSLDQLVDAMPSWFCKPYVRTQMNSEEDQSQSKSKEKPFRVQRNAELDKLAEEMGISKRQLRKRERRQIEAQRKISRKRTYPKCQQCHQPAGINCKSGVCKRCCKWICVKKAIDCKAHNFDHEKMMVKRIAYAESMGLSVDELLVKEANADEHAKTLKNAKKERLMTRPPRDQKKEVERAPNKVQEVKMCSEGGESSGLVQLLPCLDK